MAKKKDDETGAKRDSRHDEMCLLVHATMKLVWPDAVFTLEAPLGRGYCDLMVEGEDSIYLFEVKTDKERASAGDVVRQLKFYAKSIEGYINGHIAFLQARNLYERNRYLSYETPRYLGKSLSLVCVVESKPVASFVELLKTANVELLILENGELTGVS